jgi:hypothetical protein
MKFPNFRIDEFTTKAEGRMQNEELRMLSSAHCILHSDFCILPWFQFVNSFSVRSL